MIIILYLLAICVFFTIILLGIMLSTIKINIKQFEMNNTQKNIISKNKIKIGLFLFGKIKVIGITLDKEYIDIFGKKVKYKDIKKLKSYKKISVSELIKGIKISELKLLNPKIEKLDLELDVGFKNVLLTSFMIFLISTILSLGIKKSIKKYNPKRYKYIITPHYRSSNIILLKVNSIFSIKTFHAINVLLRYRRNVAKDKQVLDIGNFENRKEHFPRYGSC